MWPRQARVGQNTAVLALAIVAIVVAALFHVVTFVLESVRWTQPAVWRRFGVASQADADTIRPMALNQGFYNLFLAIVTAVGLVLGAFEYYDAGLALIFAGAGSMLAAALVLLASSPDKARAAITQGILPLIAIVLIGLHLAL